MEQTAAIRDEIIASIEDIWGIHTYDYEQNHRGYLNLKWKLYTDRGFFFVKQYNWDRYSSLDHVKQAAAFQKLLQQQSLPCPRIVEADGNLIHETPSGERFILTDYCEGRVLQPGTVNADQMLALGLATGRMHTVLNAKHSGKQSLHWELPTQEMMIADWNKRWKEAVDCNASYYLAALEKQRSIIDHMDVSIFAGCEEGWVHWDLWVDNLLFSDRGLEAILDFDRLHFIYPEFDVSRALLSCTLRDGKINQEAAHAFLDGYRQHMPITREKVVRSMKLTWWKEAEWVGVKADRSGNAIQRFVEESVWVANHWAELEAIFV